MDDQEEGENSIEIPNSQPDPKNQSLFDDLNEEDDEEDDDDNDYEEPDEEEEKDELPVQTRRSRQKPVKKPVVNVSLKESVT